MQAAVEVVTVCIVLHSVLIVMFIGIIDNIYDDGGNIIVIGRARGIICGSADVIITI